MTVMTAVRAAVALFAALASQPGIAGDARTVDIGMFDSMRFSPGELTVPRGETIRFVVRNAGKVEHEIVIGTHDDIGRRRQAMHHAHGMASDMLHLVPGARATHSAIRPSRRT